MGALILAPTRELAQQTFQICREICQASLILCLPISPWRSSFAQEVIVPASSSLATVGLLIYSLLCQNDL